MKIAIEIFSSGKKHENKIYQREPLGALGRAG